jgi:hypothetical protein
MAQETGDIRSKIDELKKHVIETAEMAVVDS